MVFAAKDIGSHGAARVDVQLSRAAIIVGYGFNALADVHKVVRQLCAKTISPLVEWVNLKDAGNPVRPHPVTYSYDQLQPGIDLARQMAQRLRREIHGGTLPPGEKLPTESVLSQRYGTSRSVVREALSMLRQSGLIVSRRGSGSFVAEEPTAELRLELPHRSFEAVIKLLELRRAVEVEAARLAAVRHTPSQLRRIRNAMVDIDEAVENGGTGVEQDMAFHRSIAQAANNTYFTASIDFYNQFLQNAITVTRTNEAQRLTFTEQVVSEHQAILDAIATGDATAAAESLATHLNHAEERLRQAPADLFDRVEKTVRQSPPAGMDRSRSG